MTDHKKALRVEAMLWLAVTAVAILLAVVLLIRGASQRAELQDLQEERSRLSAQVAELQGRCAQMEARGKNQPGLLPWEVEDLQKKGLTDPVADLIADLQKHPELIGHEGVLGGTMAFGFPEKIHVLTDRWVLAYFEDGHVAGWMLLEYEIARGGKIAWRVIDSYVE